MTIKKVFKIAAIALATLTSTAIIIAFFALVNLLPNPREIAQTLKASSSNKSQAEQNNHAEINKTLANTTSSTVSVDSSNLDKEATTQNNSATTTPDQAEQIRKMLDEDPRDLRVCKNLGRSKIVNSKNKSKEKIELNDFFSEEIRLDSVAESYRFAVRNVFQDEAIAPLMHEILDMSSMNLPQDEADSFLTKINFYTRAAYAAANLYAKKSSFEAVGNRAHHLALVAQIAALKPELANNENIYSFCNSLETSIAESQAVDIKEERKEILKLISYAGLTPEDLGFDPKRYIKFQVQNSDNGINFSLSSCPISCELTPSFSTS